MELVLSTVRQTVFTVFAGILLWSLCKKADRYPKLIAWTISVGFLVRALAGQVLFWISYLQLPFARSMQLGNGFWFFGLDGIEYFAPAAEAGHKTLFSIVTLSATFPSVGYIKALALLCWLLGSNSSVALLLNLLSFLGAELLIAHWAIRYHVKPALAAVPIATIALLPSWVLFALQPMKDAFFCTLVVLFAFAADAFREAWGQDARHPCYRLVIATVLVATIYGIASIRWYYALIALCASTVPLASILWPIRVGTRRRTWLGAAAAVLLLILAMSQAVLAGAGPYLPDPLAAVLKLGLPRVQTATARPAEVLSVLKGARQNLDSYRSAGTRIRAGRVVLQEEARSRLPLPTPPQGQPARPGPRAFASPVTEAKQPPNSGSKHIPEALTQTSITNSRIENPRIANDDAMPVTLRGRLVSGIAALILPRTIATRLGLVSIGGGRGFWWFAEIDTLMFDLLLMAAIGSLIRSLWHDGWQDPFVWYLLVVTAAISVALAYTVSNFGTLFRHREMIVATLAIMTIAPSRIRQTIPAIPDRHQE